MSVVHPPPDLRPSEIERIARATLDEFVDCVATNRVDVERILEAKLRIHLIPVEGLFGELSMGALLSSSFDFIWVDRRQFEEGDQRQVRYSLAHELGHFKLHRDWWVSLHIDSWSRWLNYIAKVSHATHYSVETQCDRFADFLLVPTSGLAEHFQRATREAKGQLGQSPDRDVLAFYVDEQLATAYEVPKSLISKRLNQVLGKPRTDWRRF